MKYLTLAFNLLRSYDCVATRTFGPNTDVAVVFFILDEEACSMDGFVTVRAVTESGFVSVHSKGMEGACD